MPYTINFTDQANKGSIIVEDSTLNTETSLKFPGRNTTSYGAVVAENFLHLLENFASVGAPQNPVEGQLWYDTTASAETLMVYDGTNWVPAGGMIKSESTPLIAQRGDLWVDKDNQQLYLYTGAGWVLVGPGFSQGLSTGTIPVKILGKNNVEYTVLQIEVDSEIIAIISSDTFEPKATITGFSSINPGVNVRTTGNNKFYGVSSQAENLLIGNEIVPGASVLRIDTENTVSEPVNIQNNLGLNIGINGEISYLIEGQAGIIQHNIDGSSIDFRTRLNETSSTVVRIDSSRKVGINNLAPDAELDVTGNVITSGNVRINSTDNAFDTNTGSLISLGGMAIRQDSYLGGALNVAGTTTTANIIPDSSETGINRVNGSASAAWFEVHGKTFYGDLFVGSLQGSVDGIASAADTITRQTKVLLRGDVTSVYDILYDGAYQDPNGFSPDNILTPTGELPFTKVIKTEISNLWIEDKDEAPDLIAFPDDELIINVVGGRVQDAITLTGEEVGLRKIKKKDFLADVPTTPVGSVIAYAGIEAPTGWLLCDGAEYDKIKYAELFAVVDYYYRPRSNITLENGFAVPDMRGRLPLGKDDMDQTSGDGFGGAANRVTGGLEEYPVLLGGTGGSEFKKILKSNLPDHEHDFIGADGQFFAIQAQIGTPTEPATNIQGLGGDAGGARALPNSGGIDTDSDLGQDFSIMPPTLTLNYIIYAGVV